MRIHEVPNPLPLKLMVDYVQVDLTGIPAEELVLIVQDSDTHELRRGTGTFHILDPFAGQISYTFSLEDVQQPGNYELLHVEHNDRRAGIVRYWEFSLR